MTNYKNINDSRDKDFYQAWDIYTNSFPIFEQRNLYDQIEAMKDDNFNCRVYIEEDNVVGLLFFWNYENYRYIEHFAISKIMRGKNYGSNILKEFCEEEYSVILEIDPPIDEISISRLNFYKRLGFVENEYNHIHPPYRRGSSGHGLEVLSYDKILNKDQYNLFNEFLKYKVMKYSENK